MRASIVGLVGLLLALTSFAAAQSAGFPSDRWLEGSLSVSGGRELAYRLLPPAPRAGSEEARSAPLVVLLHGLGGSGRDNRARGIHSFDVLASPAVRSSYPAYLLTPQLPAGMGWEATDADPLVAVAELTERVVREHRVDPGRIYLVGEGSGAEAARRLAIRAPGRYAAVVLLSGVERPAGADELAGVPLWVFHGAEDERYPVAAARALVSALWAADARAVRYTEYPELGHASWERAWEEPRLLPWLFSQRRE
ncbi:MAG: PHB depolymerase family esterase [Spirochaetota bacterium]